MEERAWTVREILTWTEGYLERHDDPAPRLAAELLLAHILGQRRIDLYMDMDRVLLPSELEGLRCCITRRGRGEPIQYITGTAAFRHISVSVGKGVLIPRPETEVLVSEVLSRLPVRSAREVKWSLESKNLEDEAVRTIKDALSEMLDAESDAGADPDSPDKSHNAAGEGASVDDASVCLAEAKSDYLAVDLGTGSGVIACSLAYERDDINVIATDISETAVVLARQNVRDLGLESRVKVLCCDLGEGIPDRYRGAVDVVVSNPPYIPTALLADLSPEVVEFEPRIALDGGEDGNEIARRILSWSRDFLAKGGLCCLELHEDCLDDAAEYALSCGYAEAEVLPDLTGRPRVLVCRLP